MRLPPPAVLATWPVPNYINPETRGPSLVILNAVSLGLATIIILLRIYTRCFIRKWFGWDDILICLAYLCVVGLNVLVDIGTSRFGWDRHIYDIPLSVASDSLKAAYFAKILFLLAGLFTAFSLLAFYYRLIAESGSHWFRWILHVSFAFNIVSWLPFMLTQIFVCTPPSAYWQFPEPAGAKCINEGPVTLAGAVVKVFIDFMITTLPLPLVLRTKMQKRQRYGVAILFSLGYLVTAAGAVRTYFGWKLFHDPSQDVSWWEYPAFMAATVENNLAVITACVPTIRPLFPHFFGGPISRFRSWLSSNSQSSASNPSTEISIAKPERSQKRNSRLSQLGSTIRYPQTWNSRSFPSVNDDDDESDVKLVTKKNGDGYKGIELDNMVDDTHTFRKSSDGEHGMSRERKQSVITVGDSDVHPFDPRLDRPASKDHF